MTSLDVLVVDDDADGRNALTEMLESDGCTVRQAENGSIAVKMIGERVPSVMFLDLEMPVMDGWAVLDWTRRDAALRAIAVIVLSAGASPPTDVTFIRKPCSGAKVLQILHRVAGGEAQAGRAHDS